MFYRSLLRRFFKSNTEQVNFLYFDIRNGKTRSDQSIFALSQLNFKELDQKTLANYSYILASSYKQNSKFDYSMNILEKSIASRLKDFNDISYFRILLNFQYAYRQSYTKFTKEFLIELLNRITKYKDVLNILQAYEELSKFLNLFKESQINYEEIFMNYLKTIEISQLKAYNFEQICGLLSIISNLLLFNNSLSIKNINNENILDLIYLEILDKHKEDLSSTINSTKILKYFILCHSPSEDFIRNLEEKVFNNLSLLTDKDVVQLLVAYKERKLHDYHYIINQIYKPFYEYFLLKFDSMNYTFLCRFLMTF